MSTVNYEKIRDQIKDGDFIFFKAESLKQRFICWFTGGQHSHCGIANWLTDSMGNKRLMVIESFTGGCRMVTLSSYSSRGMDIVTIDGMDWGSLAEYVTAKTGLVHYGMFDFVTVGLRDVLVRLGFKHPHIFKYIPNGEGEICSEMLADVLSKFKPVATTLISPANLFKLLLSKKWVRNHLKSE